MLQSATKKNSVGAENNTAFIASYAKEGLIKQHIAKNSKCDEDNSKVDCYGAHCFLQTH